MELATVAAFDIWLRESKTYELRIPPAMAEKENEPKVEKAWMGFAFRVTVGRR